jgi:Zn-dependent metalloprotease
MPTAKRTKKKSSQASKGSDGLNAFSMHMFDESSSGTKAKLRDEQAAYMGLALPATLSTTSADAETIARGYLQQALESASLPSFTAPASDGGATEFKSLGTETIPLTGTTTVKFRQTVNKIPLYGSLITVELDEHNGLVSLNSVLGQPTGVNPVAAISPADAVKTVADRAGGKKQLSDIVPRMHFYFNPKGSKWRLVYILENVPLGAAPTRKAGARSADLERPHFMDYVVDAHSGKIIAELPRTPSMASTVQEAADGLGAVRKIRVEKTGNVAVLKDSAVNVATYDFGFRDPTTEQSSLPGKAVKNPPKWAPAAVSAHANAVSVAEFMRDVLRRNNIDNKGGPMISTVNCVVVAASHKPKEWLNAFWSPGLHQMVYGQAVTSTGLRSLSVNVDVVAHEMFHGVTDSTSRLEYALQPGALNESHSDIFGIIVSNVGEPDPRKWNWELGEGLIDGVPALRDMSDPKRFGQPAHMDEFKVLPNTYPGDWGGVHTNSGIHNKAAYNMLTGEDSAHNLILTPTEVAAVFYLSLTQQLSRTSQFIDSRRGVVTSALTLFRNLTDKARKAKIAVIEQSFEKVGIR